MPLLTKKLSKINLSLQYDTITLYPIETTKTINDELMVFVTACGRLDFILPGDEIDSDVVRDSKCGADLVKLPHYDRSIFRDDPDHNLYHQDEFELEKKHYHIKCKSMLNQEKLKAILDIALRHEIMTKEEVNGLLEDFNQKYQVRLRKTIQTLTESKEQKTASKAINSFIKKCTDIDELIFLHEQLLSPQFAFLRTVKSTDVPSSAFFKAVVSADGTADKTSKAWAEIEESIELQMVHILDTTCRMNPSIGEERAKELRSDVPFFGMQHKCDASTKPTDESTIMKLLKKGDVLGLEDEYTRHFKACG